MYIKWSEMYLIFVKAHHQMKLLLLFELGLFKKMSHILAAPCIILMLLFLNSVLHEEASYGRFHYDNWHRKTVYEIWCSHGCEYLDYIWSHGIWCCVLSFGIRHHVVWYKLLQSNLQPPSSFQNKAVNLYQTKWYHIPEDSNCTNIKPRNHVVLKAT